MNEQTTIVLIVNAILIFGGVRRINSESRKRMEAERDADECRKETNKAFDQRDAAISRELDALKEIDRLKGKPVPVKPLNPYTDL